MKTNAMEKLETSERSSYGQSSPIAGWTRLFGGKMKDAHVHKNETRLAKYPAILTPFLGQ